MKLIKFMRFRESNSLQKVTCTESYCILFFLKATLILNKTNFQKIHESNLSFENAIQIEKNLILSSKQRNAIIRISTETLETQPYNLPFEHNLINLAACPYKKFLVAVTRNRVIGTHAILFWLWDLQDFVYIFDGKPIPNGISILGPSRLVVYGGKSLRVFDSDKIKFMERVELGRSVRWVEGIGDNRVIVRHVDETCSIVDLLGGAVKRIGLQDLLFLRESNMLLHVPTVREMRVIKF